MINKDCKHMSRSNKLNIKTWLMIGAEFLCAIACGGLFIGLSGLIAEVVKNG